MRIGTGFDLHRTGAERPLVLAGVVIPDAAISAGGVGGLVAHSDGDVVLHALTDAILGAAGQADIGDLFPDTDPRYKDADSAVLLQDAMRVALDGSFRLVNVDLTVLAERPKLKPHRAAMRARLSELLSLPAGAIGVKFTTMEGLGAIGRGEAIACQAVCLLEDLG